MAPGKPLKTLKTKKSDSKWQIPSVEWS